MTVLAVTPLTLAFAVTALLLALVAFVVRRTSSSSTDKFEQLKKLPGPVGLPVIGCSHIIGRYKKHWDAFSAMRKEYGDIYGLTVGSRRCVVISSMSHIKEVLVAKSQDFANRPDFLRFHAIFRGNRNLSIALCDWSEKQKIRRELTFPFMHPRVQTFDGFRKNDYIMFELEELTKRLSPVSGQVIDPRSYLLFTTANIFYQYLCGKRFDLKDETFQKVVKIYDEVFKELFQGFAVDFMPWLKVFNGQRLRDLKGLAENVSQVTETLFKEHEQDIDFSRPRDLIDIFLCYLKDQEDQQQGSTNSEQSALTRLDAEVIIEDLVGGHPVLGNLWLWGLYFLADNPDVQKNIREEVAQVTGNCRAPSIEDKPDMPYTEATMYELLRCIASPIIPHVATKDTSIRDYKVVKDTMVMFNLYDINMDPQLWDEPNKFKPHRFISASGRVRKPDYFLPFSTGKRTCLGDGLVRSTLFLGLSTVLQNFEISLPERMPKPDIRDIAGIVVPQQPIFLVFNKLGEEQVRSTAISMT